MISSNMDFREFCQKMKGRSKQDIIQAAEQEANLADAKNRRTRGRGSTQIHAAYRSYVGSLGKLLNILKYNGGATLNDEEETIARPMLESMTNNGLTPTK